MNYIPATPTLAREGASRIANVLPPKPLNSVTRDFISSDLSHALFAVKEGYVDVYFLFDCPVEVYGLV